MFLEKGRRLLQEFRLLNVNSFCLCLHCLFEINEVAIISSARNYYACGRIQLFERDTFR